MLPKQRDVEISLLQVLVDVGGQGRPRDIYPLVTQKFPQIREEDLAETLKSGTSKWTNRIQWVRQTLIEKHEMDSPARGTWRITEKGRMRLAKARGPLPEVAAPTFLELYDDYEASFRARLQERLECGQ
jgi:restriction system protein